MIRKRTNGLKLMLVAGTLGLALSQFGCSSTGSAKLNPYQQSGYAPYQSNSAGFQQRPAAAPNMFKAGWRQLQNQLPQPFNFSGQTC